LEVAEPPVLFSVSLFGLPLAVVVLGAAGWFLFGATGGEWQRLRNIKWTRRPRGGMLRAIRPLCKSTIAGERQGSMAKMKDILKRWDITVEELTAAIDGNPSLRGMLHGYVAEHHLRKMWFSNHEGVTHILKQDDHERKKKGDLVVTYKSRLFKVECKSLQTNSIRRDGDVLRGKAQCDASDRRKVTFADDSTLETTCLLIGEFDLLAVNLFAFEEKWRFIFAKNVDLPRSRFARYTELQRQQLLASLIPVSWPPEPPFRDEPFSLFDEITTSSVSPSSPSEP
jgi:hypothetical protein